MTSPSTSKAQRRAENKNRAAEKEAAAKRHRRRRVGLQVGGVLVVVAVVVIVVVTQLSGGGNSAGSPARVKDPHLSLAPIPASMSSTWVQPPAGTLGPEKVPVPKGPKLASLFNAATGQPVDGVQCQSSEKTVTHVHTHLTIFVNGQARVIPAGVGVPGAESTQTAQGPFVQSGSCFYWLHVHAADGIIHIESPSKTQSYTLGQFFDEWGIPLSSNQVGAAKGKVTVFFRSPGKNVGIYTGNPRDLPLGDHYEIQLDVGTPVVAPVHITNWSGL